MNVLKGNAALVFNGTQTGYQATIPLALNYTICDVFQKTAGTPASGNAFLVDGYYIGAGGMYFSSPTALTTHQNSFTPPENLTGTIANDGNPHSYCISASNGLSPASVTLYQDFVPIATFTNGSQDLYTLMALGAENNGTNAVTGNFFYHIMYYGPMSSSQAVLLATYIQNRFGILQAGAWSIQNGVADFVSYKQGGVPLTFGAFSGGLGSSYQDVTEIATPSDPASGVDRIYTNSSTHLLGCLTPSGGNCMPSGGAGTISSTTPVINTAACIKAVGPPVAIGYCSTALTGSPPTCTCN
jgi:hypothetical protein